MNNFFKKYKDPRWQKKRLLIMERDNFLCQNCRDSNNELVVHHLYYEGGKAPWEYPDNALVTYCKPCHEEWHRLKKLLNNNLSYLVAELEWLVKCANYGPPAVIKGRFENDTRATMLLLDNLCKEAMSENTRYHSQIVDCCLELKGFVQPEVPTKGGPGHDQGKKLE